MSLTSINPATGEILKEYPELTEDQIEAKLAKSQQAYQSWKTKSYSERAALMKKLAQLLIGRKQELGKMLTLEMGKTLTSAIAEVEKSAEIVSFYADNAEKFLAKEIIKTDYVESYVEFDPIGLVLAIMPWNFPFWQVFRFAAPAIMAGNIGVLKHASNVPQASEAIENLFLEAGFPEGVFTNLHIGSSKVAEIIADSRIKAITLTGSEAAGSKVAETAGKYLKKTVLELGGSDPFIVLDDKNLEHTVSCAVYGRLLNNGQSCICSKRFIVVKEVMPKFLELYKQAFEATIVGDPMNEKSQMGPLVSASARDEIHRQVTESVKMGAKLITGGEFISGPGFFYKPTILTNLKPGMPAFDEELFGPVAAVIEAESEEDAIRIANNSDLGLGSTLWSSDDDLIKKLIPQIEAGSVYVNTNLRSDQRLPFGGIKKSGYGREMSSYGIKEFVNIKTVVIEKAK